MEPKEFLKQFAGGKPKAPKDVRIVYGVSCTWWDSIDKAVPHPDGGLPSCPHCHSVLFEEDETKWMEGMTKYELEGHPGYQEMMTWSRGKCFSTMDALEAAWPMRSERCGE